MGRVFVARDLGLERSVAIKVLDVPDVDRGWAVRRFLAEAQLAARARHANVVKIYDFGSTSEGLVYIVMEHLVGRDLRAIVRQGGLGWRWTRHIMRQICWGVGAIHRVGVVHRDLKASNCFFVERNASVKVLDFGVATLSSAELSGPSDVVGTPEYMPPEQIRGEPVTAMADVYAAGVLTYELLTGRTPFHSPSVEEVFDMHLHAAPPSVSERPNVMRVPRGLDDVLGRALAKDPSRRYPSMEAFAAALERADRSLRSRLSARRWFIGPTPAVDARDADAPTSRHASDRCVNTARPSRDACGFGPTPGV